MYTRENGMAEDQSYSAKQKQAKLLWLHLFLCIEAGD